MATTESVNARRAALLLHGMPSAVRTQIISRLGHEESARLTPLLNELRELGVTSEVGRHLQAQLDLTAPSTASDVLEQTDCLDAAAVARCLKSHADAVVAELLRAREWSWKPAVLERIQGSRRFAVLQAMQDTVRPAPAVLQSLCRQLCAAVAALPVSRHAQMTADEETGLGARLRRWWSWSR